MRKVGLLGLLASCLASVGQGRRSHWRGPPDPAETLAVLLQAFDSPAAFNIASTRVNSLVGNRIHAGVRQGDTAMIGHLKSKQEPSSAWPGGWNGHRVVSEDEPTFQPYSVNLATGYTCKSPQEFFGLRMEGRYEATFRVQFTLPGRDEEPKTIEFMRTNKDNPSFGAVRVKSIVGAEVEFDPIKQRLVIRDVKGSAKRARLARGDMIRAVSVPENAVDTGGPSPYDGLFGVLGRGGSIKDAEGGLLMLDGKLPADYEAAIAANMQVNGKQGEIVLLIERPTKVSDDDDWWPFGGGKGEKVGPDFADRLKGLLGPQPQAYPGI